MKETEKRREKARFSFVAFLRLKRGKNTNKTRTLPVCPGELKDKIIEITLSPAPF
jgi:hypothetical protein